MKPLKNSLYLILAGISTGFVFTSCEEVIQLDLNNSEPKLVIESVLNDSTGPITVKLSRSVNFYQSNTYDTISDAQIRIDLPGGNSETLKYLGAGVYQSDTISRIKNESYSLRVSVDNTEYTAQNAIPEMVNIDSLVYEKAVNPRDQGYMVYMYFSDPGIERNYYRIKVTVDNYFGPNQSFGTKYILYDDKIYNGNTTKLPAIRGASQLFHAGDTVTIDLYSLSKPTYEYYSTLRNVVVNDANPQGAGQAMGNASAPANPISNFNNGALGYFGAYSVSRKQIVIKP